MQLINSEWQLCVVRWQEVHAVLTGGTWAIISCSSKTCKCFFNSEFSASRSWIYKDRYRFVKNKFSYLRHCIVFSNCTWCSLFSVGHLSVSSSLRLFPRTPKTSCMPSQTLGRWSKLSLLPGIDRHMTDHFPSNIISSVLFGHLSSEPHFIYKFYHNM